MTAKPNALATKLAQGSVVAAAAKVFARLGFAAARVEDILEGAGIARRTFYKYFDSKEDVLAALYDVATAELLTAVTAGAVAAQEGSSGGAPRRPTRSDRGDALDAVRAGVDVYLGYHVENALLMKVLVEHAIRSDSPLAKGRKRFRDELVRVLDYAVRQRTGEENDPLLYLALVSALEGVSLELLASTPSAKDVARAKRVMHLLIDRALRLDDRRT